MRTNIYIYENLLNNARGQPANKLFSCLAILEKFSLNFLGTTIKLNEFSSTSNELITHVHGPLTHLSDKNKILTSNKDITCVKEIWLSEYHHTDIEGNRVILRNQKSMLPHRVHNMTKILTVSFEKLQNIVFRIFSTREKLIPT